MSEQTHAGPRPATGRKQSVDGPSATIAPSQASARSPVPVSAQDTLGNHGVVRGLRHAAPALARTVSAPGDAVERAGDQIAHRLTRERPPQDAGGPTTPPRPRTVPAPSGLGGGQVLPGELRTRLEPRLGVDLATVRVHHGMSAAASAQVLGAEAYTVGNHIVFGQERYAPRSEAGAALLLHELAHVAQHSTAVRGHERVGESAAAPILRKTEPTTFRGYTTYAVPVPGDQQLVVQFHQEPGQTYGAMLTIKASGDSRPPLETPIPTGPTFAPTLLAESNEELTFSLDGSTVPEVTIWLGAGTHTGRYYSVNPKQPRGPLLIDVAAPTRYLEAAIAYPGGSDSYAWADQELPDEIIAAPKWQPFMHPGLGLMHRAVAGKYTGQAVSIGYGEAGALRALESAFVETGKMVGSLALYSIPYLGPLVIIGEVAFGRTIWGDKLSTEGRVLMGLLALLPVALAFRTAARGAAAEAAAASELAAANGISREEALVLLKGASRFTPEEQAFVKQATADVKAGQALSAEHAGRLAGLLKKIGQQDQLIFSAANDIEQIWQSERYWGQTEGAVYGMRMPATTWLQRLRTMVGPKEGLVIFQGEAAKLFHAHEIEGGYSAMKRLLGQQKSGFGDIILDKVVKQGSDLVITEAHLATAAEVQHAGQSTSWATARVWGRRIGIEPAATAVLPAVGWAVAMYYDWFDD